jgi:hypothetical protein
MRNKVKFIFCAAQIGEVDADLQNVITSNDDDDFKNFHSDALINVLKYLA